MNTHTQPLSNFAYLKSHDEQLVRLGMLAEKYFTDDPNTCLLKLRQFAELLAQLVAAHVNLYATAQDSQYDLLYRLREQGVVPREVAQLFDEVRRSGNQATHALGGDHRLALNNLKLCWQLGLWFHRTFQDAAFKSGPFVPPGAPKNENEELRNELARLNSELAQFQASQQKTVQQLEATTAQLRTAQEEQQFWEQMAIEAENAKVALSAKLSAKLAVQQIVETAQTRTALTKVVSAANSAAREIRLDEAETRELIDQQLRLAGWEADSINLAYRKGARPEKGKNRAIAEWPTLSGPADYILFIGLMPVAAVEAKRRNVDVAGKVPQAKRYSRTFSILPEMESAGGAWGKFRLPFVFSANGRPFLRQIKEKSGIWFCDVRRSDNLSRPLDGWYTPEGLQTLLKRDETQALQQLITERFDYGFALRPYQVKAIQAVEAAVSAGQRELLVAMATGTGKTKTCIALIYRLLKVKRFRRVLFLVDRSALGEQAANAFKDTRMENLQTFANIFGIKELDEQTPDSATALHIATVQGMVKRLLYANSEQPAPAVDQYDCIIVDECHRGYLLDRELSDTELSFRDFDEYISKYRRVLDYFDAVKIGLTATPAQHTSEIFGKPIFSYSYREAVIDGFLIDHEPPFLIKTQLSSEGIHWQAGDTIKVYDAQRSQIDLYTTPDQIDLEVDAFNRQVLTESFNQVVCEFLARELDPAARQKTLVFCVTDSHADLVVRLLKEAFQSYYGTIDDDAVIKITGSADKPLQLIRRFKNEHNPTIAVTVDLLTTGVDVPEICNLVFLRRVNSRILYEQMMGRATRLCPEIGKETFRIFDAVHLYDVMKSVSDMQPVVVDPNISFRKLTGELTYVTNSEGRSLVLDQFIAKLQRKKAHLSEDRLRDFEIVAGMTPNDFISHLRQLQQESPEAVTSWFLEHPGLGELLDRQGQGDARLLLISEHADQFYSVERGYGKGVKPEDYLQEFASYINSHQDSIPVLLTVLTRPRELTRKQLRQILWELDQAGFSEANLATAWRELTNQEIAAHIIGFIRQAAIGDPLLPYDQRVDAALQRLLATHPWSTPQRQWLQRIATQTKVNGIVDREAIDDPDQLFRREGGGFARLDRLFDGTLQSVLETFNDFIWQRAA